MTVQFPEHKNGAKSNDSKVAKLDKLARLMNVVIHIDGVAYGAVKTGEKIVTVAETEPTVDVTVSVSDSVESPKEPNITIDSETSKVSKPRKPRKPKN